MSFILVRRLAESEVDLPFGSQEVNLASYLNHFPAPFLEDVVQARCIPFIGAGFSRNALVPPGAILPDWDELGRRIAAALPEYQYTTALDAISAYSHEYSRAKLVEALGQALLIESAQPGSAHKAFCELPFETVVTTNFEFLLEFGYASINRACVPIVNEDQLAIGRTATGVRLLKLHGDFHHPTRLIATEEDYDGFLGRYPLLATYLSSLLISSTALFIGYSLDDPDLRQVWQVVKERLGGLRRPAYVIQVDARPNVISRYERRGVKVINLPSSRSHSYGEILETAFRELLEHWTRQTLSQSMATEDEQQAELSLPLDARGRMCFFAVPTRLAAFYKSLVYPIVERHGFSPCMAVDVVAPGDSIMSKVYALIERAEVIVADAGTPSVNFEIGMALAREDGRRRMITVVDEASPIPADLADSVILRRPTVGTTSDYSEFLDAISLRLTVLSEELRPALDSEPQRLMKKREYRAAAIAAFSLLEHQLRRALEERNVEAFSSRMSLGKLIGEAFRNDIITLDDSLVLRKHLFIRNELVHTRASISQAEAKRVVNDITELAERIRRTQALERTAVAAAQRP